MCLYAIMNGYMMNTGIVIAGNQCLSMSIFMIQNGFSFHITFIKWIHPQHPYRPTSVVKYNNTILNRNGDNLYVSRMFM